MAPHYGTFDSTLDEKGRVVIPAGLRERYQGELWMTMGVQTCVWIMTPGQLRQMQEEIEKNKDSLPAKDYQYLLYQFFYTAKSAEIDPKSGRIPVPGFLRKKFDLSKDCLVISADNHLEIWGTETFWDYMQSMHSDSQNSTNRLVVNFLSSKEAEA